jgi:tetratricopeptide (TPR) repeat protein
MERPKHTLNRLLTLIVLYCAIPDINAESSRKTVYNAFINREMYKWDNIIHSIETNNPPTTIENKLELINYYYGYIGYLIGQKHYEKAENYIIKGEKLIDQILHNSPKNSTTYAFKGSFLGFRIGISKFKAIYLGPESISFVEKSLEIDPQNIQGIIDRGNIYFYTPSIFGGDKHEALNFYLKAARLMERNKETDQNWAYLNLLTTIGIAYDKLNKTKDAKLIFEKILRKEPNFKWVKEELYPKLIAKIPK